MGCKRVLKAFWKTARAYYEGHLRPVGTRSVGNSSSRIAWRRCMGVEPTLEQEAARATVLKTARPTGTVPPPFVSATLLYQRLVSGRSRTVEPYWQDALVRSRVRCSGWRYAGRPDVGVPSVDCGEPAHGGCGGSVRGGARHG